MYRHKYLKYRSKYVSLKNRLVGGIGPVIPPADDQEPDSRTLIAIFGSRVSDDPPPTESISPKYERFRDAYEGNPEEFNLLDYVLTEPLEMEDLPFYDYDPEFGVPNSGIRGAKDPSFKLYHSPLGKLIHYTSIRRLSLDYMTRMNEHLNDHDIYLDDDDPQYVEKLIVDDNTEVIMMGDLHSDLSAIIELILSLKSQEKIDEIGRLREDTHIVFLGDMLDRGPFSIEILFLVISLKVRNFENVHVINGNHEEFSIYSRYGALQEYLLQFSDPKNNNDPTGRVRPIKDTDLQKVVKFLPSAIFLKFRSDRKWYQLCHGGIPSFQLTPYVYQLYQSTLRRFLDSDKTLLAIDKIKTGSLSTLAHAFQWGDFTNAADSVKNERRSFMCGREDIQKWMNDLNLNCIIRGHQDYVNLALIHQGTSFAPRISYVDGTDLAEDCMDPDPRICKEDCLDYNFGACIDTTNVTQDIRIGDNVIVVTTSTANTIRGFTQSGRNEFMGRVTWLSLTK